VSFLSSIRLRIDPDPDPDPDPVPGWTAAGCDTPSSTTRHEEVTDGPPVRRWDVRLMIPPTIQISAALPVDPDLVPDPDPEWNPDDPRKWDVHLFRTDPVKPNVGSIRRVRPKPRATEATSSTRNALLRSIVCVSSGPGTGSGSGSRRKAKLT